MGNGGPSRAVAITGLGTVGSYGTGAESLREALVSSTLRLTALDRSAGYHRARGSTSAALVGSLDLSAWLAPAAARRMSLPSRLAVASARMALEDAGLVPGEAAPPLTAVVLATALGPTTHTEKLLLQVIREGPETASPFLFAECVANAPAAQVAIACRAVGPNVTIAQREAGPLLALARGAAEVASGRAERALVGAVEEIPALLHAALDRFDALARGDEETPRPFDRRRDGFVAGEGATVLVLEPEDAARERGARVRARVKASASAFDATASRVGWGRGAATLGGALGRMFARAGLEAGDIDRIVSGASGALGGDRLEARTLRCAWNGTDLPAPLAPKAVTGEYGGGHLASAVLAVQQDEFGPTRGFREEDPDLGVTPHRGGPLPPARHVLATSLAAGGAAAWVVLERP